MAWAICGASKSEKKKLLRIQKLQPFAETIIEGSVSILTTLQIILTDILSKKNYEFNVLYFSLAISLVNVSTRLTQEYINRIRSSKNYKYAKDSKSFEELSEEEKLVIFSPRLSIMNIIELLNHKRAEKLYSQRYVSSQNFRPATIIWIWTLSFVNVSAYSLGQGLISQAYVLPNYGFSDSQFSIGFPLTFVFQSTIIALVRGTVVFSSSRGWTKRSIDEKKSWKQKSFYSLILISNLIFDYCYYMREEIPFLSILEGEVKTNENWIDNPEPQVLVTSMRILFSLLFINISFEGITEFYHQTLDSTL